MSDRNCWHAGQFAVDSIVSSNVLKPPRRSSSSASVSSGPNRSDLFASSVASPSAHTARRMSAESALFSPTKRRRLNSDKSGKRENTAASLGAEQAAIMNLLLSSSDNAIVVGRPGQGKTHLISTVVQRWLEKQAFVVVVSPTHLALCHFDKFDSHPNFRKFTAAALCGTGLGSPDKPLDQKRLNMQAQKLRTHIPPDVHIVKVVFDEAFMTGAGHLNGAAHMLSKLALLKSGPKSSRRSVQMVFVGDPQQLGAVNAQHAFRSDLFWRINPALDKSKVPQQLLKPLMALSLTGPNFRFKGGDPEHTIELQQLEAALRQGKLEAAIRKLGVLMRSRTPPTGFKKHVFIITRTHAQRNKICVDAVQDAERRGVPTRVISDKALGPWPRYLIQGAVHRVTATVGEAKSADGKAGRGQRLVRGLLGEVKGWTPEFAQFTPSGKRKEYLVPIANLQLAAGMTIHSTQGLTLPTAVVDFTSFCGDEMTLAEALAMMLVAVTRSKTLYVKNLDEELILQQLESKGNEGNDPQDEVDSKLRAYFRRLIQAQTICPLPSKIEVDAVNTDAVYEKICKLLEQKMLPFDRRFVQVKHLTKHKTPSKWIAELATGVTLLAFTRWDDF
ncbi:MAG: hypothetical protein CL678_00665 [Bdellovibrionaceae bacterium]|nr:hypothetical protein [Pseudobdellovibrionaceae bacterium]